MRFSNIVDIVCSRKFVRFVKKKIKFNFFTFCQHHVYWIFGFKRIKSANFFLLRLLLSFSSFQDFVLMGRFFQRRRIFVGSAFFKKQQKIKWSSSRQTFFLLKMPFCGFVCWHKFRWFANIIFFTTSYFIAVATFKVLRFWNKV